ncbi:MAG: putative bifunctional diguanylate cyclase/phosphodiesterase [Halothiobacillaceae bacterium]
MAWQPQIRLSDGAVIGAEVLARWRHPTLGEVPPGRCIPIAEEGGLIDALGHWVLDEASRQATRFCQQAKEGMRFSINLSPRQMSPENMHKIAPIIERHGLRPKCIEPEITESTLMDENVSIKASLQELGAMGFHFAVDDFGTGYSNLAYLKRFPVHRLKIGQTFIHDMLDDETDRQIVATIIQIGHNLGLKVIAEGVETEAQRDMLQHLGCDEAQGYLFARPLPLDEFSTFLNVATTMR